MFGSTRRNFRRATSLALLMVLGILARPAANLRGQDKGEKAAPPPMEGPGAQPPAPAQPLISPTMVVQPVPSSIPSLPPQIPSSGPGPNVTFPGQGFNPPNSIPQIAFGSGPQPMMTPPRFPFTIDPKTPLKKLLPVSPNVKNGLPFLTDDLTQVPEVQFQMPLAKTGEAMKNTAHLIAKINHLNAKKADGFLEALRADRPDLQGMPFAMGDACRTKGERNRQFTAAVASVRAFMQQGGNADNFWTQYLQNCTQCDAQLNKADKQLQEHANLARIAALMQVFAPESPSMRLGLIKYLSTVAHVEATRALAKLAIFSAEEEVRQAATDALKVRRERDYTDVLVQGLRYPWPTIAKRSADALVKLERNDLIPQLIDLLDEPDPRSPVMQEVEKKKVPVIREMVKVNHHRNCLMCHAPGNTDTVSAETLAVPVPTPDQPLAPPSGGYNQSGSSPDLLVRIDVTYLRQDFSMLQPVADAAPWPEMQRFDFFVRTRELSEEDAAALRAKLDTHEKGRITPYQRATVTALRELTGKDTAPTSKAWRELLDLPERARN